MRRAAFFLMFLVITLNSKGQGNVWENKSINNLLDFKLPLSSHYSKSQFIKEYAGQLNSNYYSVQFYDTVFFAVENERQFTEVLQGVVSGKSKDPSLRGYGATVVDTAIGNTKGLFVKYMTTDASKYYEQISCYVTLVNNRFYWFFTYSPFSNDKRKEIDLFFKSILFESEKIKERNYKLPKIYRYSHLSYTVSPPRVTLMG